MDRIHSKWVKVAAIVAGAFLYAFGMNYFLIPYGLYSGGGVGIAQVITYLIGKVVDLGGKNIYGIVYFLTNIPLLLLAWKGVGKNFLFKTIIGSTSISLFASIIPIPAAPIVDSVVASVLIAGIVTGFGVGMLLVAGGSGGGVDIIGVWAARKFKHASVGKISLFVNAIVYACLLLMFDIEIVIYSLIYMVFFTLMMDRTHYQNITVRLMIFTKHDGIDQKILKQTGRGVTEWTGIGAYTREETKILICCINKYEQTEFIDIIHSIDPNAFVIADEGVSVMSGNFEKRL